MQRKGWIIEVLLLILCVGLMGIGLFWLVNMLVNMVLS